MDRGNWGYHPKLEPSIEATAWSAIALRHESFESVLKPVSDFLLQVQNSDGGWSTGPKIGQSDWSSGPALLALRLMAKDNVQLEREKIKKALKTGFEYLFDSRVDFLGPVARLIYLLYEGPSRLNYGRGWPWTAKAYNWVEPTSYNLLALRIPHPPEPEEFSFVIEHAQQFLIDHACLGGGWNHGANYCLKKYAPPYVLTTAEALLALQDLREHKVIKEGLSFLQQAYDKYPTCLSLAWTVFVFAAYNIDTKHPLELLQSKQNRDGSFGSNLLVTALSAIALDGDQPLIMRS
jgi:hypothetical protein